MEKLIGRNNEKTLLQQAMDSGAPEYRQCRGQIFVRNVTDFGRPQDKYP